MKATVARLALLAALVSIVLFAISFRIIPALSQSPAPLTATLFYDSGLADSFHGTMVVDSQGRLLVSRISCNTSFCGVKIQSISQNGTVNWLSDSLGDPFANFSNGSILLGPGDRAYYLQNGSIIAFDQFGTPIPGWPVTLPNRFGTSPQPVVVDRTTGVVYARTGVSQSFTGFPIYIDAINPDGTFRWRKEYSDGNSGGVGLYEGPDNNFYTYIFPVGLAQIDRNTGAQICISSTALLGTLGTPEGVFSVTTGGTQIRVVGSDCNASDPIYTTESGKAVGLYDAAGGRLFGFEYPLNAFDSSSLLPLCLSTTGAELWRNPNILQQNIISARPFWTGVFWALRNDVLYTFGRDILDGNKRKLFLLNAANGQILNSIETAALCQDCGVAVGYDGTIYLSDLRSTKIFKISGGPSPCTVSCTATVPSSGGVNTDISFVSAATPANCTQAPTYEWDFGDGSSHSSEQNPSHIYSSPGTYTWSLKVRADEGIVCTRSGSITVDLAFSHPVSRVFIAQPYGRNRRDYEPTCQKNQVDYFHTGIDYGNAGSLDILAAADGKVIRIPNEKGSCRNHGLGNTIIIEHTTLNGTVYSLYGHLSAIQVTEGQQVDRGQTIGTMGSDCTGSTHLHLEIKSAAVLENPVGTPCGPKTCFKVSGNKGNKCYGYTYGGGPDNFGYFNPLNYIAP